MAATVTLEQIYSVLYADLSDPFDILGAHIVEFDGNKLVAIRCFFPDVDRVFVIDVASGKEYEMEKIHKDGFFERICEDRTTVFKYKLRKCFKNGGEQVVYDKYSFLPVISEDDLYLYNKGDLH